MHARLLVSLTLICALVYLPSASQKPPQVKRKLILPDLPGTVNGTSNPEAIPDTVAYELFMRSIADYPSENLFIEMGLHGNQITNALNYVQSFELAVSLLDQGARTIKGSRNGACGVRR